MRTSGISSRVHGSTPATILAFTAALAGVAHAQCDIFWPGIADFDQRRQWRYDPYPIPTHVGLPNNGSVHCVPTAATNLLAMIDSSGYNVIRNASTNDWAQQNPIYNAVGTHLYDLGQYMKTDDGGTSFADANSGLYRWLVDRGHGSRFIVFSYKASGSSYPKPKTIHNTIRMGFPTMFGYGRYYRDGAELERDGGHAVTAVGVLNACNERRPVILYHDPNTDPSSESQILQSPFERVTRTFYRRFLNMDGDNAFVYAFEESFSGTSTDPVRVIDSYRYLLPLVVLGTRPSDPTQLKVIRLGGVWKSAAPANLLIDSPTGGGFLDAVFNYTDATYLALVGGGRDGPAGLFRYDPVDDRFERLGEFPRAPDRMLLDRFGDVFLQLGSSVEKYTLANERLERVGVLDLPAAINAWAIDDATDGVVALADAGRRIYRFGIDLGLIGNTPIPGGLTVAGDGSVAVNPLTGRPWIASSGVNGVFEVVFDPASGRASLGETASHGGLRQIRGIAFGGQGDLIVSAEGSLRHYAIDPGSGRWAPLPGSPWPEAGDLSLGRLTDLPRSRHNESPRNAGRGWYDIDPVDEPRGESVPVCEADFNLDGFVDYFDFFDFIACFERGECPAGRDADLNLDGFLDFFDVDAFIDAFERGC
ncbi:MAG: hypothetical protein HRU70_09980 [Phycisphaeraceae bacterium]|nr:MAG: hypothetical protein HRU70_09980 [Phycisphaeraceae bacterium]